MSWDFFNDKIFHIPPTNALKWHQKLHSLAFWQVTFRLLHKARLLICTGVSPVDARLVCVVSPLDNGWTNHPNFALFFHAAAQSKGPSAHSIPFCDHGPSPYYCVSVLLGRRRLGATHPLLLYNAQGRLVRFRLMRYSAHSYLWYRVFATSRADILFFTVVRRTMAKWCSQWRFCIGRIAHSLWFTCFMTFRFFFQYYSVLRSSNRNHSTFVQI